MLDWSKCPGIESVPDKMGGEWVFVGTRLTVATLFGNLADGADLYDVIDWYDGVEPEQLSAVLEFVTENLRASAFRGSHARSA